MEVPSLPDTVCVGGEVLILAALPRARAPPRWRALTVSEAQEVIEARDRVARTLCLSDAGFAQPLSFRRSEIPRLLGSRFLVALKTDGERCQLFLTTLGALPRAFLIFRSTSVVEVEFEAVNSLYAGTLMDGEMVVDRTETVFLVFDGLIARGKAIEMLPYTARHAAIQALIPQMRFAPQSRLELRVKTLSPAPLCASVWRHRLTAAHLNDGLIFTQEVGTQCYKWKHLASVDVLVKRGEYTPYVRKGSELMPLVHLRLGGKSVSNPIEALPVNALTTAYFHTHQEAESVVLEVFVEKVEQETSPTLRLVPARLRLDKSTPNHIHTAAEAALAAVEGVTVEELAERLREQR